VIAKAAGIESTAKIKSVVSIKTIIRKRGVKANLPFSYTKKFDPVSPLLKGRYLLHNFRIGFFSCYIF
jgi:hypothetical protein